MPASWVSVLIFICFVAPGFYYEQISRTRRVRAKESTFREVSRTVLGSVAISVPAGTAAFCTWLLVTEGRHPDFSALLRGDNTYVGTHFGSVIGSIVGYLFASVVVARLVNFLHTSVFVAKLAAHLRSRPLLATLRRSFFARLDTAALVSSHTLWTELFRIQKREEREAIVSVVMKSGHTWWGVVGSYSADHEMEDRELVLHGPILFSETPGAARTVQVQNVLVLIGSEIASIGVNYAMKTTLPAPTPAEGN